MNRDKETSENRESIQSELEMREFYLSTLSDVSRDIFGALDSKDILHNFLLMTTGNFGVKDAFILLLDLPSGRIDHWVSLGFQEEEISTIRRLGSQLVLKEDFMSSPETYTSLQSPGPFPAAVDCILPFNVDAYCFGLLGLGSKILGTPYDESDKKILDTLINCLVISLQNARSFEDIKRLYREVQEKGLQLEKTVEELQTAIKKLQLLEGIKANLSKFVPTSVWKVFDGSATATMPDSQERDVSVLFLDIEGYTVLSERLPGSQLNDIIEKYFSVFLEAIYNNNGDVNETAGDSLMVLFLNEDRRTNALEAVRTALMIRQKAAFIQLENHALDKPLLINMGINSGPAFVGAAKFESCTGSRWTFTARGMTTNLAARIGYLASGGQILVSKSTADRVSEEFPVRYQGRFNLKNVSEDMDIFAME
jgi:class 3 adenylate cyclase